MMKKMLLWCMMLAMLLGLLVGCGKKEPDAPQGLAGTWEYSSGGYAYTFNADGTGAYTYSGTEMPFTYTDDGAKVSILFNGNSAPNEFAYTISGNTLSIEDSFGELVEYTRKGGSKESAEESQDAAATPASFDWWNKEWYGWWCIKEATGVYEPANKICWDAYAKIEVLGEQGSITLWDTGTTKEEPLLNGYVDFIAGKGEHGAMADNWVSFFPYKKWNNGMPADMMDLEKGSWTVDPADSSVKHFKDMIEIKGHYQSPENAADGFDYYIYLRPWGTDWSDVQSGNTEGCIFKDMMPVQYAWYQALLGKGCQTPPTSMAELQSLLS